MVKPDDLNKHGDSMIDVIIMFDEALRKDMNSRYVKYELRALNYDLDQEWAEQLIRAFELAGWHNVSYRRVDSSTHKYLILYRYPWSSYLPIPPLQ